MISTDLKRSASNLKPMVSATTIFLWWNVSMLRMTTKTYDNLHCLNEMCFEPENTTFRNNHILAVKRVNIVHDNQSLLQSVLIWRVLLRTWNQRFLHQPFSYCETSQCCPWQTKPRIIGTDLKRATSNLKPTASAATISYGKTSQCCPWQQTDLRESVLIWKSLLRIWNHRFLQQLFSYCEMSQCCPWQPEPWTICTDLKRSASNLKPTASATTIFS